MLLIHNFKELITFLLDLEEGTDKEGEKERAGGRGECRDKKEACKA